MSKTIDERVVEMRFDNEDFESNAKESLGTLDRLKQALSFKTSTDEVDKLARSVGNVDMDGLGGAVEAVKNKFSALEIIAVTALMNITNKAINAGEALVKSLTLDQVSAGWDKYADKTTAVQTIMSATADQFTNTAEQMEYVNAQLDKLNAFTDETSYNFVDMVGNIGKFTSNNIALDTAVTSMQGIATWAAMSGQNASTASRAMYQLSQAMGSGVIRLTDWMSIEQANMATAEFKETALETAVSLGTLTKSADGTYKTLEGNTVTIESFRGSLQDLWFTSDVLTGSLEKYGKFSDVVLNMADESGLTVTQLIGMTSDLKEGTLDMDHWMDETGKTASELQGYLDILGDEELDLGFRAMRAAQEAKTFQEAIDATKDAVSTGWMNTFEIIFGDYEEAKTLWTGLANELYDVFAASGEERNELLEDVFEEKKGGWDKLASSVENVGGSVEDFQNILIDTAKKHGIEIDKMIEDAGSFEKSLKNGWLNGELIKEGLFTFRDGLTDIDDATSLAAVQLDELGDVAKKVINGDFGEGDEVMESLVEAGYDYDQVMRAVNKITNDQELSFTDLTQAQLENLGITADQAIAMEEYRELCGSSKEALSELTDEMINGPKKSGRDLLFESIANVWESIKTILGEVKTAWQEVFPPATAEQIYNSLDAVNQFSAKLKEFAEAVAPTVGRAFKSVFLVIDTFLSVGKQVASFIGEVLMGVFSKLDFKMGDFTGTILDVVQRFHDWITQSEPVKKALDVISKGIEGLIDWVMELVNNFTNIPEVQEAIQKVQEVFGYLFDKVSQGGPGFMDILDKIQSLISENFPNLTKIIGDFIDRFKEMDELSFGNILESLGMLRDDLFGLLTEGIGKGNTFQKFISNAKTKGKELLDMFNEKLPKFNAGTVLSVGLASSLIATILKFGDLAKAIKSPVTLVNNLFSAMTGAFKNLGAVLKGVALIPLALGIGMIAEAIAKLAQIPAGNVLAAGVAIGVVTGAIAGLVYAIGGGKGGKGGGLNSLKQIGVAIVGIAITMGAVAGALYALSKIDLSGIVPKLILFGVIVAAMIGVTLLLSHIGSKMDASISGVLLMIGFAGSVWILIQSLKEIANDIVGYKTLEAATTSLFDIILGFGLVMGLIAKFGGKNLKGGATSMILMALSIKVLVGVLEDIKDFDANMILDNFEGYFAIFAALLSLAVIGAIAGKGVGVSMLSLIGSVLLMALALKAIEKLDFTPTQELFDAFLLILLGLAVIMRAVASVVGEAKDAKFVQLGAMMLEFSAALIILAAAVAIMGMIPQAAVIQGGLVVAGLMVLMGGLIFVTKFAQNIKGQMIALTVCIGILVAAVALFAFMGPEAQSKIWEGVAAVGALMAMLAILIIVTKLAGTAWQGMAMLAGVIVVVGGVIFLLSKFTDIDKTIQITQALAEVLGALSLALVVAAAAGTVALAALIGIGIMVVFLVAMAGLMALLNAINGEQGTLLTFINSTIPIFEAIGEGIGKLFGGIVEGFSESAANAMTNMMTGLKNLATGLGELNSSISPEMLDAVSNLIGVVTLLTAEDFLTGIKKLFGGDDPLTSLGKALESLGPKISSFAAATNNVEPSKMNGVAKVLDSLVGVAERFTSADNVELMGETLEKFGPQFKEFNDNIAGIDPENVRAMAESLTVFADAASKVQESASSAGGMDLWNMMEQLGVSLPEGFETGVLDGMPMSTDAMNQMLGGIQNQIDLSSIDLTSLAQMTGGQISTSIGDGVISNSPYAEQAISYIQSAIRQNLSPEMAASMSQLYGQANVSGIAQGMLAGAPLTDEAAAQINQGITNQMSDGSTSYLDMGKENVLQYVSGLNQGGADAKTAGRELSGKALQGANRQQEFQEKGDTLAQKYLTGLRHGYEPSKSAGGTLAKNAYTALVENISQFYNAGVNAGQGFVNGLSSKNLAAANAGAALGKAAANAAKKQLAEKSPSKVFEQIGDFGGVGFVRGLIANVEDAYTAGQKLGGSSLDGVSNAISAMSAYINDNLDANPTITPILDLSEVRSSSAQLASMLNDSIDVTRANASVVGLPVRSGRSATYGPGYVSGGLDGAQSQSQFYNTFYIQSHDPQGVANETSRIIQRQVARRDASYGRTGL